LLLSNRMLIPVNSYIHLSELEKSDEMALVRWLNDEVIYRNTLRIPLPYKPEHARDFLRYARNMRREHRHATEWAIRNTAGEMIGCIGFSRIYGKYSHKDELGYWLAAPYRGRGIMTEVVAMAMEIGFRQFDLWRLEAPIFPHNLASGKVLEKNGFVAEGTLKNYVLKNSKPMDVVMYAKVRND
jgi:[ribosomal protein S5]-alanine N-acetyltransferase